MCGRSTSGSDVLCLLEATIFAGLLTLILGFIADARPVLFARLNSRAAVVACGLVAVALAIAYGIGFLLGYSPT